VKRFFYLNFRIFHAIRFWMRRRFPPAGRLILAGAGASAILGLDTRLSTAYQVFTFLVSLLVLAWVWNLFFKIQFSARRILPRFGTAGVPLAYRVEIHNQTRTPRKGMWLMEDMQDPRPDFQSFLSSPEPGEDRRNPLDRAMGFYRWEWLAHQNEAARIYPLELPPIPAGARETVWVKMEPQRRGILHFTGLTLARPDPFGLYNGLASIPLPQSLTILPCRYALPRFRLPGTRQYQTGGVSLTGSVGDSEEFISLRDYRPGDPIRRIHWRSLAKTGRPVVKEFKGEFFVRHALILDTFQQAEHSDIFEAAVSVAASFACTVQTQESLLDLMFVGSEFYCFTSGMGLGNPDRLLEILAAVRPCHDKPFETLSTAADGRASALSGAVCVLLEWDEARRAFVRRLQALGVSVLVLVVTEDQRDWDSGDMKESENVHPLRVGSLQKDLDRL
jgi:uncharacterized protein (DUF58 family)